MNISNIENRILVNGCMLHGRCVNIKDRSYILYSLPQKMRGIAKNMWLLTRLLQNFYTLKLHTSQQLYLRDIITSHMVKQLGKINCSNICFKCPRSICITNYKSKIWNIIYHNCVVHYMISCFVSISINGCLLTNIHYSIAQ